MNQVSPFLRKTKHGYGHYCPGCCSIHIFYVDQPKGPNWTFDGDLEKPTFGPSMRVFFPEHEDEGVKVPEETVCHYFLKAGVLEYCGEKMGHDLSGQKIPLPRLPDHYSDDNFNWGS